MPPPQYSRPMASKIRGWGIRIKSNVPYPGRGTWFLSTMNSGHTPRIKRRQWRGVIIRSSPRVAWSCEFPISVVGSLCFYAVVLFHVCWLGIGIDSVEGHQWLHLPLNTPFLYIHSKNKHVIAFELYGKGNNQCAKRKEDTYIMDVGQFSRAYVAQRQIDYKLQGNNYGNPGSMDYLECTAVQYGDALVSSVGALCTIQADLLYFFRWSLCFSFFPISLQLMSWQYYAKLGCAQGGGLKLYAYTDESCTVMSNTNIGLYNDIKVCFLMMWGDPPFPLQFACNNPHTARVRFNSIRAKAVFPGLPTVWTPMLMINLKVTTCMIPSFAAPRLSTSKAADGDVWGQWRRGDRRAPILMWNVRGMGLRSSASSSGPLLVSVIFFLVSHIVLWPRHNHYFLNCLQICSRSCRICLGCVETTTHDDPRRCHSRRGGHEWRRT